ncbi:MAG: anti-sigma factor [Chloracidobacterium sp.]|nr:anti-sigma factor [Chloracidobacterium sp.]
MSDDKQEKLIDLLILQAVSGLDQAEKGELYALDPNSADEFSSIETTVAAINIAGAPIDEPLPSHLFSKITAEAQDFVGASEAESPWPPSKIRQQEAEPAGVSWFGWLGWAAAAAACVALALNIWFTRTKPIDVAEVKTPPPVIKPVTPTEQREELIRSATGMVKANWAAGNVKEISQITGDVVWSDEKQTGYMRFKGLPKNDGTKETYQLWIFDKTQKKETPIDGGTFDVTADGEVIIPINAKLKAQGAEMFAITIEKPGGVVVSDRKKIAALAKVGSTS